MSAVRLARGVTGRSKIIKMTGHYHGHVDALLVQAGSAATTLGTPNSPGVTEGCRAGYDPLSVQRRAGGCRCPGTLSSVRSPRSSSSRLPEIWALFPRGRATSKRSAS